MPTAAHPRRRAARPSDASMTPHLIDSFKKMTLRKGDTFNNGQHSKNKTELWDPLATSMPSRSTTCPKSLEDLLIGAGERRTVDLLQRVERAVAQDSSALGAVLSEPEVLPVNALLSSIEEDDEEESDEEGSEEAVDTEPKRQQRPALRHHRHSSDSGLGSSILSDTASAKAETGEAEDTDSTSVSDNIEQDRGLSRYAAEQIHKYIVKPILDEQALKDFHPLIERVPERIGNKSIKTLRDLERTLIFLAPDFSRSPTKYLQFCERTIRVLHATATTLHESDQRAPADRPYTQGYFFDLVEQIRRYAQILAATRARQEQEGKKADEMATSKDETVSLHGGMTHNGKPAELVRRTKDGKTISLATGEHVSADELASSSNKRPMPADLVDDDEEALRSMARRKKGAKPEIHTCSQCDKEFKRPCDLTKHIKTHERPWKCPAEDCKFHEYGFPTEKERDRHHNDKHANNAPRYYCQFQPCPYSSKRESNCKQHMEKAHGWQYVRSKSNGKGRLTSVSAGSVTRLPQGSAPQSPAVLTPYTPVAPSPSSNASSYRLPPPTGVAGPSTYGTPVFPRTSPDLGDFSDHFNFNNFDFNNLNTAWPTPSTSADRRTSSAGISSHSGVNLDDTISPDDMAFDNFNMNFTFSEDDFAFPTNNSLSVGSAFSSSVSATSPGAQLDQTFTAPQDPMNMTGYSHGDFTLFGGSAAAPTTGAMMPSLPAVLPEGSSWGNFGGTFDLTNSTSSIPSMPTDTSALRELFPDGNFNASTQ